MIASPTLSRSRRPAEIDRPDGDTASRNGRRIASLRAACQAAWPPRRGDCRVVASASHPHVRISTLRSEASLRLAFASVSAARRSEVCSQGVYLQSFEQLTIMQVHTRVGRMIAPACRRGKSELRRAGCSVTRRLRKGTESATENKPPRDGMLRPGVRVKRWGKSPPPRG